MARKQKDSVERVKDSARKGHAGKARSKGKARPTTPQPIEMPAATAFGLAVKSAVKVVQSAFALAQRAFDTVKREDLGRDYFALWCVLASKTLLSRLIVADKAKLDGTNLVKSRAQYIAWRLGKGPYGKDGASAYLSPNSPRVKSTEEMIRRNAIRWGNEQSPKYVVPSARVGRALGPRGMVSPSLLLKAKFIEVKRGGFTIGKGTAARRVRIAEESETGAVSNVAFDFHNHEVVMAVFASWPSKELMFASGILAKLGAEKLRGERDANRLTGSKSDGSKADKADVAA